jgi:hypothetical protein
MFNNFHGYSTEDTDEIYFKSYLINQIKGFINSYYII